MMKNQKKLISLLLVAMVAMLSIVGCSNKKDDQGSQGGSSYASAVEILETIWDNFPEENKFAAFGGGANNSVEDKPGSVDVTDTDTLTYNLLVPEALQSQISDAASLIHMLNANSFTCGSLKVTDADKATFIETLKTDILGARFMCGFPERLVIISTGDYVVYAYGTADNIEAFENVASEKVEGVKVEVDQLFE